MTHITPIEVYYLFMLPFPNNNTHDLILNTKIAPGPLVPLLPYYNPNWDSTIHNSLHHQISQITYNITNPKLKNIKYKPPIIPGNMPNSILSVIRAITHIKQVNGPLMELTPKLLVYWYVVPVPS